MEGMKGTTAEIETAEETTIYMYELLRIFQFTLH
ncbi:DUF1541 domain-containing protein [Alkalihalobacillus deserti]